MAIFGPKRWVNFSTFSTSCFYSLERPFFVLEYRKRHFPGLYCLKKKMLEKWPFFDQNHGFTPFEKCQFLDFFNVFFFIASKGDFSFQNIVKDIFLAYIALKKMLEKWPFLDQNRGLTPLETCQFFDFMNFWFLQPRQALFRCKIF